MEVPKHINRSVLGLTAVPTVKFVICFQHLAFASVGFQIAPEGSS